MAIKIVIGAAFDRRAWKTKAYLFLPNREQRDFRITLFCYTVMVHIHVCIHVRTGYMFDCWYMYSTLILRCNLK